MRQGKITTSYGRIATVGGTPTGYLYGSGYGRDPELSGYVDRAADLLAGFGLPIEKRGNSDRLSAGAHYDGKYGFGLGAWRHPDHSVTFEASFDVRLTDCDRILEEVPNQGGYRLDRESRDRLTLPLEPGEARTGATVYSPQFTALEEAWRWLYEWGRRWCPALQGKEEEKGKRSNENHRQFQTPSRGHKPGALCV